MAKCTPSPDGDDAAVAIALVFYAQDTKNFLSAVLNNLALSSFLDRAANQHIATAMCTVVHRKIVAECAGRRGQWTRVQEMRG